MITILLLLQLLQNNKILRQRMPLLLLQLTACPAVTANENRIDNITATATNVVTANNLRLLQLLKAVLYCDRHLRAACGTVTATGAATAAAVKVNATQSRRAIWCAVIENRNHKSASSRRSLLALSLQLHDACPPSSFSSSSSSSTANRPPSILVWPN